MRLKILAAQLGAILSITMISAGTFSSEGIPTSLTPPSSVVPSNFFGMHIHRAATGTAWPNVPFQTWRLWDTDTTWRQLEPSHGKWDFRLLDKLVGIAQGHHVEPVLVLGQTPVWASARPGERGAFGAGAAADPADLADWRNYVRAVATRYKGRIRFYEIWNEPNLQEFYSGTPQAMANLTREAARVLKEVDPGNVVVSPSPTSGYGVAWLEKFLAVGGGGHVDVIGYHFYVTPKSPEAMIPLFKSVLRVMNSYGINKPLWNTEAGWFIANHQTLVRPTNTGIKSNVLTEDETAAYLARAYVLAWAAGVQRFYWYAWDNREMGLTEGDGVTVKSSAKTYELIQRWLLGSQFQTCYSSPDGTWACRLKGSDGKPCWIVWNPERSSMFSLPAGLGPVRVESLDGRWTTISGSFVQIGSKPVFIKQ